MQANQVPDRTSPRPLMNPSTHCPVHVIVNCTSGGAGLWNLQPFASSMVTVIHSGGGERVRSPWIAAARAVGSCLHRMSLPAADWIVMSSRCALDHAALTFLEVKQVQGGPLGHPHESHRRGAVTNTAPARRAT